ncbi:hypothetical protein [Candidatus Nephthysia bennettiae]|uniref:Uncharacterized protein n=1 Tax=Candidatus Nephthysia bennettiae TaxID=3127016 RepID=A0A934K0E6_9BACT|nr:hypothetical protein [Candidatus Dormibacteraeota bacterium]
MLPLLGHLRRGRHGIGIDQAEHQADTQQQAALLTLVQVAAQTLENVAGRGLAIWALDAGVIAATVAAWLALPPSGREPTLLWPLAPLLTAVAVSTIQVFRVVASEDDERIHEQYERLAHGHENLVELVKMLLHSARLRSLYLKAALEVLLLGALFTGLIFLYLEWVPAVFRIYDLSDTGQLMLPTTAVGGAVAVFLRAADEEGRRWARALDTLNRWVGPSWVLLATFIAWAEYAILIAALLPFARHETTVSIEDVRIGQTLSLPLVVRLENGFATGNLLHDRLG